LVLNWCDGSSGNPVNGGGQIEGGEIIRILLGCSAELGVVSEQLLVLVVAHVRELVDALGVGGVVGLVAGLDVRESLSEEVQSVLVFFFGAISSVVLGNEVDELSLGFSDLGGQEGLVLRSLVHVEDGEGSDCA